MKKAVILFLAVITLPFYGISQTIENIDYISPFNDGVAAIKKGNQWAFINTEGAIVVNFRDDLISTKTDNASYPVFIKDRCIISQKKEGISYFGYIDKSGHTVIEPQFLNATNFNNDVAIVLKLVSENVGKNMLNKDISYYKYYEVLINLNGEVTNYLSPDNATSITLDKDKLIKPPKITSKSLSNTVVAIRDKNNKWLVKSFKKY